MISIRKFLLRNLTLPRPEGRRVRLLSDTPDPTTGLHTANFWIVEPWYVKPTFWNRWGLKAILSRLRGGAVPVENGPWRDGGYDLRTIGPAAQEGRGREEMEAIFEALKGTEYALGCPFR